MRWPWRIAVVSVIAVTMLGAAFLAAGVRTYTVSIAVPSAFAIWNDEELVLFVPRQTFGTSGTILQQLVSTVSGWAGMGSSWRPQLSISDGLILRLDNGVVRTSTRAPWAARSQRPRFIDGRLLVFGGVWNGSQIDTIDRNEYMRQMASSQPDDPGGWHSGFLLESAAPVDLPLQIHGEHLTLRGARSADGVTIDLVGPASSTRLAEVRSTPRAVSAREFNALFGVRPTP